LKDKERQKNAKVAGDEQKKSDAEPGPKPGAGGGGGISPGVLVTDGDIPSSDLPIERRGET